MLSIDLINLVLTFIVKPAITIVICLYLVRVAPNSSASKHHWTLFLATCTPVMFALSEVMITSFGLPITPLNIAGLHDVYLNFNYTFYLLVGLYLVGVFCGVFYLLIGIWEVHLLQKNAQPLRSTMLTEVMKTLRYRLQITKTVSVLKSEALSSPIVWGAFSPTIILPTTSDTWSVERASHVLCHELAHVKRNDWPIKIFLHLMCCLFWFFPPVWRIAKKCRWYAELACDDYVIEKLQCRAEYAQSLMDFAHEQNKPNTSTNSERAYGVAALNLMNPTLFYLRIHAVLDGAKDRVPFTRAQNAFYTFAALILVLLIASAHFTQANRINIMPNNALFTVYPVWSQKKSAKNVSTDSVMSLSDLKKYFYSAIQAPDQEQLRATGPMGRLNSQALVNEGEQVHVNNVIANNAPLFDITRPEIDINSRIDIQGYLPVKLVSPKYPRVALQKGLSARVVVVFDIGTDGKPFNVRANSPTVLSGFNKMAKMAVTQSEYLPLTIDGHKIITKNAKVAFNFTLDTQ